MRDSEIPTFRPPEVLGCSEDGQSEQIARRIRVLHRKGRLDRDREVAESRGF